MRGLEQRFERIAAPVARCAPKVNDMLPELYVHESPFAALRLLTDAAKRFEKVANVIAVIWKMLLVARRSSGNCTLRTYFKRWGGSPIPRTEFGSTSISSTTLPDSFTHLLTGPYNAVVVRLSRALKAWLPPYR